MKLGDLARRARRVIDQRGGSDALKQDAQELRDIARGEGTLKDKAKRAADAMKEPGAHPGPAPPDAPSSTASQPAPPPAGEPPAPPRP